MRKIILKMQSSLDGVVSDVGQWMTMNDDILKEELEFYDTLDAFIVGGKTYPGLAAYWQEAEKSSDSDLERQYAKRINEMEKLVLSRSNVDLVWKNSRQIPTKDGASLSSKIEKLRNKEGKDIAVVSGLGAWQVLLQNNLFNDLWIFVHPVVVGKGKRLFENIKKKFSLELSNSKTYKDRVVGLYYKNKATHALNKTNKS